MNRQTDITENIILTQTRYACGKNDEKILNCLDCKSMISEDKAEGISILLVNISPDTNKSHAGNTKCLQLIKLWLQHSYPIAT